MDLPSFVAMLDEPPAAEPIPTLPAEYVSLMTTYGAGTWRNWLRTFIPLRPTFVAHVNQVLDGYRSLREEFPAAFPLAAWPEPGGFLPFADSIDGDYFGWLTEGGPDDWPLIVWPRHEDQGSPMRGGLVDTLLEWSRGRVESAGFAGLDPRDDPLEFATFEPADAEWPW